MNDYYAGYDEKYPDLIIKILEYFDISNNADLPVVKKDKAVLDKWFGKN